ncbi:hypothetical protein H920_03696 [Fukomys damarensis]|uniref:Uncharacterized protein n=1 Tax=Fukomys damarensis TaxID=885580 RepID=A0A091DS64_FUKDA|nr:hypothetical protein H920_03696 [Fukomys damarensis]
MHHSELYRAVGFIFRCKQAAAGGRLTTGIGSGMRMVQSPSVGELMACEGDELSERDTKQGSPLLNVKRSAPPLGGKVQDAPMYTQGTSFPPLANGSPVPSGSPGCRASISEEIVPCEFLAVV